MQLLLDVHVSASGGGGLPLDTHAAPLLLSPVMATRLLFRPSVMAHGLLAHFVAEALLSAPQMLGSLELLLNPTGQCPPAGSPHDRHVIRSHRLAVVSRLIHSSGEL